jgi:hypothetical protein
MHWFRSNVRLCSRLALLALAAQMQLSLGHVHFPTVALPSAQSTLTDGSNAAVESTNAPVDISNGSSDHYCPICALIHLLTTVTPPGVPTLPLPGNLAEIERQALAKLTFAPSPHFSFRPRAPPSN